MSLSRYYKNTPSFQAEDLVKQSKTSSSGWSPVSTKPQYPFADRSLAETSDNGTTDKPPLPLSEPSSFEVENDLDEIDFRSDNLEDDGQINPTEYVAKKVVEQQLAEAYQEGILEGGIRAEREFGTAAKTLLHICQQLESLRATIIANSSKELLDFALSIAERIVRFSVRQQDHTITATIEEALRRAIKSDEFTIHLNPEDYETVAAKQAEIVAGISGLNNVVLRKDVNVERGGARIESDNCTIDATLAGQFELIYEKLNKTL